MKKFIITTAIISFLSVLILPSCKKYVDGPAFSLRTKKARLQGDWQLETYTLNDVNKTDSAAKLLGSNFMWNIEKGGSYKMEGTLSDDGTWKFGEDKDDVYFQSNTTGSKEEAYRILRLANKELWLKQVQSNGDVEVYKLKQ